MVIHYDDLKLASYNSGLAWNNSNSMDVPHHTALRVNVDRAVRSTIRYLDSAPFAGNTSFSRLRVLLSACHALHLPKRNEPQTDAIVEKFERVGRVRRNTTGASLRSNAPEWSSRGHRGGEMSNQLQKRAVRASCPCANRFPLLSFFSTASSGCILASSMAPLIVIAPRCAWKTHA
jgi:hypothetical protein